MGSLGEGRGEVWLVCGADALHQAPGLTAAGQADGEGVVVGVPEPCMPRPALVVGCVLAQVRAAPPTQPPECGAVGWGDGDEAAWCRQRAM